MCGRFALTLPHDAVKEHFAAPITLTEPPAPPRYNICPTQNIAVIRSTAEGRALDAFRWGFTPRWAKRLNDGPLLINARAETIAEKPAFRDAARQRRCLIPASGFYEWSASAGKGKDPWWIEPARGGIVAYAGIWSEWEGPEGRVFSCAIVTCAASEALAPIHHRMPVVIHPENFGLWLGEEGKGAALLMKPTPDAFFSMRRVGRAVNAARHDAAELMAPIHADEEADRPV